VLFSFFSLTFVGLMPAIAADNFGIRPRSVEYGLLYACFGLGAAAGAISVGTLFAGRSKAPIPRLGLVVFAGLLTAFALLRTSPPAFPVGFVLGYFYFLVITSLATVLQENLDDGVRGRIMALWIMGFGGIVPVGVLVGGFVASYTNVTLVMLVGAAAALLLAPYAKLETRVASG
jgi:hypothetical protein